MNFTENITRQEFSYLTKYFLFRNKKFWLGFSIIALIPLLGLWAVIIQNVIVIYFFVIYVALGALVGIAARFRDIFRYKAYGLTKYPQVFTFGESGFEVKNNNGIEVKFTWKNVNLVKLGNKYINIYTDIGMYWLKKETVQGQGDEIVKLWRNGAGRKIAR